MLPEIRAKFAQTVTLDEVELVDAYRRLPDSFKTTFAKGVSLAADELEDGCLPEGRFISQIPGGKCDG